MVTMAVLNYFLMVTMAVLNYFLYKNHTGSSLALLKEAMDMK